MSLIINQHNGNITNTCIMVICMYKYYFNMYKYLYKGTHLLAKNVHELQFD